MRFLVCFFEALKLGVTSFGGPVAHLAYFRDAYVGRLGWLSDERFAELLAVCQFMPGPASSQLGASIGYERGGWVGGLGSWLGFTLPSVILMILFVSGMDVLSGWVGGGWITGLKLVAVAVVANAVVGMQRKLCPDVKGVLIGLVVCSVMVVFEFGWLQPLLILLGGVLGICWFRKVGGEHSESVGVVKHPVISLVVLCGFVIVVMTLCLMSFSGCEVLMLGGLFKTGSMVFGGGHVVLPLLEAETVGNGLMSQDEFLAGYGISQAVPGPMFTIGSYMGALVMENPWVGGLLGTVAIFLPGMILLAVGMPIWNAYKHMGAIRDGLKGASAAVVGLILAALVSMLRAGVVVDFIGVMVVFSMGLLLYKKWMPVWLVVIFGGVVGVVLGL